MRQKLIQRINMVAKPLLIIKKVKIIDKKKFVIEKLNKNNKIFKIYIVALAN